MNTKDSHNDIVEARKIARQLNDLLHEDALHRLKLHSEYSYEDSKWSPNLYHRCQLMEALCRKLNEIDLTRATPTASVTRSVTKTRFKTPAKLAAFTS